MRNRLQLRSCCSPDKYKTKNSWIEMGKKNNFTLPVPTSPTSLYSSHQERSIWPTVLPWRERENEVCIQYPRLFSQLAKDRFLSYFTQSTDRTGKSRCLEELRAKKRGGQLTPASRALWDCKKMHNSKYFPCEWRKGVKCEHP